MTIGRNDPKGKASGVKLRHFNEFPDRHGKWHRYFRRPGEKSIPLPLGDMSSPEFLQAYLDAMARTEPKDRSKRVPAGTVAAVIAGYYASSTWTELAQSTQRRRRYIIEHFREADGDKPIAGINRAYIVAICEKAKPSTRKDTLGTFRSLMQYAVQVELLKDDPTTGIKGYSAPRKADDDDSEDGYKTWPEDWITQYETYWPVGSVERLGMALPLCTAQRLSDVFRMGPGMVKNGVMTLRQKKTKTLVRIPMDPSLVQIIGATECGEMVYLTKPGEQRVPYKSSEYLGKAFVKWCKAAGLPSEATMHGLRKAWCRRAAEAGLSEQVMMSVTGHRTSQQLQVYLRAINQELLATQAITAVSRNHR
jgi:Phage integrase family